MSSASCSAVIGYIFHRGLLCAVELQDGADPDFPNALLRLGLLALAGRLLGRVLPAAKLAFHLDVRAFGERPGELREAAEDHATVPLGMRDVLAALLVLVGGLGSDRERGKAAVVGGVNFGVAAEKSDEGYFVLEHFRVSVC